MKKRLILPLLAFLLTACPVEKVNVTNAINAITATATPTTFTSAGSSSLNATVSGTGTFNQSVNWNVVSGGGSLSSSTGAGVTFTAPTVSTQTAVQIKATAAGDANFSQTLSLTVTPVVVGSKPVISSFTATPANLPASGGNTTLAWNVTGATSLSIDQGVGGVTGQTSKSVQVLSAKTFTLTASNSNGSSTATAAVTLEVVTDKTPPSILSITPDDGTTGVTATTPIVVTFSEPMDQPATQTAYQSISLPTSSVSFSWDVTGTILTIKPNAPLEYAKGTTLSTPRKSYVFTLTAAAKDKAGNSLVPVTSGFTTLLEITATLTSQLELEGSLGLRKDDTFVAYSGLLVGDNEENIAYRSFLTFNLSSVPNNLTSSDISSATLKLYKSIVSGNPYKTLSPCKKGFPLLCDEYVPIKLDHVDYQISLEGTDFNTPSLADLGVIDNLNVLPMTYTQADVLLALRDDLTKRASRENRSQYRLSFTMLTDNNALVDYVVFNAAVDSPTLENRPSLILEYKIP